VRLAVEQQRQEKGDRYGVVVRVRRDTYSAIMARGQFGDTVDDVVRKLFNLPPIKKRPRKARTV